VWIWLGGESFTTMMNFCTFKNISVFRVFVKSVEPNNNKSIFKLIGKLMVWIYLSLVALWQGQVVVNPTTIWSRPLQPLKIKWQVV
jgi:hypothetical protein